MTKDSTIINAKKPMRRELLTMRFLISLGLLSILVFAFWFFSENRQGYAPLFWLLLVMWMFKIVRTLHEWYHYYNISVPTRPELKTNYTVDILTTSCPGEPREMIIETLEAMQAITYPHTSYLCDEGDDPILKEKCKELGVIHVTRTDKSNAKAGNINNALKQATGEICIILDPDHVPIPEMIDRLLPYFENPEIGFVQSVQAYKNRKESLVALGACEQTYHFYGPIMMSMNHYGTAQAIGANCAFRRKALDSIGGHAPGLAEDMHTSMLIHAQGWKSCYVPEILTRGLVPSTLSAYYKQQLKWSRGTFDIFFKTLPGIFKKLTWRQRFHYATIPLYFFYGIIDFLNILVPALSLVFAEFPWRVNLIQFMQMTLPILIMTIVIRQYSQKWLLETHERGFHFVGGLLRIGTWWIYSLGFIYTLINVKVPYIPTPKDGQAENAWRLSMTNIVICLLTVAAITYGLHLDSSPYSMFMAGLACLNLVILGYTIVIGQQKTLETIYAWLNNSKLGNPIFKSRVVWWNLRHNLYFFLRKHSFYVGSLTAVFLLTFLYQAKKNLSYTFLTPHIKNGNYYAFVDNKVHQNDIKKQKFNKIESYAIELNLQSIARIKDIALQKNDEHLLMLNLVLNQDSIISSKKLVKELRSARYSRTIALLAEEVRKVENPVYIKLASDTVLGTWGTKKVLSHIKKQFEISGVSNAIWVTDVYQKGLTDWVYIGLDSSNLKNKLNHLHDLENDQSFKSPILVEADAGLNQPSSLAILTKYNKIKGITESKTFAAAHTSATSMFTNLVSNKENRKFSLSVGKENFLIKGVSYNEPGFLYQDNLPLTRSQLRKDFRQIKEMGANTVRIYHPSLYDRNLLETASEFNLKILYGFWFEPEIDYLNDSLKINKIISLVEKKVAGNKDHNSILGWSLGNETWAIMQYLLNKPELIETRIAYLKLLEKITLKIKQIDPRNPVFVMIPYNKDFTAALRDLSLYVPSADIIGVNVYNKDQMGRIAGIMRNYSADRPYVISEFSAGDTKNKVILDSTNFSMFENTDHEKAKAYYWSWVKNVHVRQDHCIGGIAYTWHDKKEITATWYGITDYKGRIKPVYYALQKAWKDRTIRQPMPWVFIEAKSKLTESNTYTFRCKMEYNKKYQYEWFLQSESLVGFTSKMTEVSNEPEIELQLPENRRGVRLYVFVSDNEGNVVTASMPLIHLK